MHDAQSHIAYLVGRLNNNSISKEELEELLQLAGEENEHDFISVLKQAAEHQPAENMDPATIEAMWQKIREKEIIAATPAHRVRFLKTAWLRYAAAIVIIAGIGALIFNISRQKEKPALATTTSPIPLQNDALPGGNHATLTLADGRKIQLDDVSNGTIAKEGNSIIDKTSDGQIIYRGTTSGLPLEPAMNTMSTPRGGQYQLVLPDGSRVWLNAESSITYPTSFAARETTNGKRQTRNDRERRVTITGEAYFEVAKDKTKPFIVSVSPAGGGGREATGGGQSARGGGREATGGGPFEIEVLGTHFNVRAYEDEDVKTSLAEGSVRISPAGGGGQLKAGRGWTLKPGEAFTGEKIVTTNIEGDLAWTNGLFYFNRTPMKDALRQFARWYDVDVVYEGHPNELLVTGEMQRSLNLSQALDIIKSIGLKYRIENKKLIVL